MPYNRPGVMKYVTATKSTLHGAPCVEGGASGTTFAGVAVKQASVSSGAAAGAPQKTIGIGEKFAIIHKGVVQIDAALVTTPVVGDTLFILNTDNTISKATAGGKAKLGVVIEVAGTRGCPTGKIRVDLDMRDTF